MEHIAGPPLHPVQRDSDGYQGVVAVVDEDEVVVRRGQTGLRRPPQGLDVAQAAVTVFEVGLEQERDVTCLLSALDHAGTQGVEPAASIAAPARVPLGEEPAGEPVVPGDRPGAELRGGRVEVCVGAGQLLIERSNRVAELQAGVPQRVPERRGELLDAGRPPVMDEEDVDVAVRGELVAAVAAHRDEGHGPLAASGKAGLGIGEERSQEVVGGARHCGGEVSPTDRAVGDQLVAAGRSPSLPSTKANSGGASGTRP